MYTINEKKLKYKSEHTKLDCECPPTESFTHKNVEAFRWVHKDFNHENNFKPVLLITPSRIDEIDSCESQCSGYGLSLFIDEKKAEKKLISYLKRKPMLSEIFGDSIAVGKIDKEDGVINEPDKKGHFTFHESDKSNIKLKFEFLKTCEF